MISKSLALREAAFGSVVIGESYIVTNIPPHTFLCLVVFLQLVWELKEIIQ